MLERDPTRTTWLALFFSKCNISGIVAGLKQLRGGTWRVTITGGSAEAVAVRLLSIFVLKDSVSSYKLLSKL